MTLLRVERHARGPRVFVLDQRLHHATAAMLLAAVACWHDREDWRDWFRLGSYSHER